MTSVEDAEHELAQLDVFLKSDTYNAFLTDLDAERLTVEAAIFESVPQTDGDVRDREQKMGLRTYIVNLQTWFTDRREAVVDFIADAKLKHSIT